MILCRQETENCRPHSPVLCAVDKLQQASFGLFFPWWWCVYCCCSPSVSLTCLSFVFDMLLKYNQTTLQWWICWKLWSVREDMSRLCKNNRSNHIVNLSFVPVVFYVCLFNSLIYYEFHLEKISLIRITKWEGLNCYNHCKLTYLPAFWWPSIKELKLIKEITQIEFRILED